MTCFWLYIWFDISLMLHFPDALAQWKTLNVFVLTALFLQIASGLGVSVGLYYLSKVVYSSAEGELLAAGVLFRVCECM